MPFKNKQSNLFTQNRYTQSALTDRIKKILAAVKLDIGEYNENIEKHKKHRDQNKYYYDYDLELDFSIDTKDPNNIETKIYDDRLYYYKAHQYLKLGLFLKKDAPAFKIQLRHLTRDI